MKLAIYGYDTIVGKMVLEMLDANEHIHLDEFYPLSPIPLEYDAVPLKGKNHLITFVNEFDFSKVEVALFLTTKDLSETWIPVATAAGCIVIDDSHLYSGAKGEDGKATVIASTINPFKIGAVDATKVAALPHATSIEIAAPLNELVHDFEVRKLVVTALIAASEHGELGTQTLARETTMLLNGQGVEVVDFPAQLAFNVLTRVGAVDRNGVSEHERTIIEEVRALVPDYTGPISLTCIQVPTFYGHTLSVQVELTTDESLEDVKDSLSNNPDLIFEEGIKELLSQLKAEAEDAKEESAESSVGDVEGATDELMVSPVTCADFERDAIFLSRLRKVGPGTYDFTAVMDNTRYGEAKAALDLLALIQKHRKAH